jgi:hypothetical protein
VAPGLYEVSFGFYPAAGTPRLRRSPPLVQLLVNGEVALTAAHNPHAITHATSAPANGGHPALTAGGGSLGGAATPGSGARTPYSGMVASPGLERATSTTGELPCYRELSCWLWHSDLLPAEDKKRLGSAVLRQGVPWRGRQACTGLVSLAARVHRCEVM